MGSILIAIVLWSSLSIVVRLSNAPVHHLIFFPCLVSSCLIGLTLLNKEYRASVPSGKALLSLLIIGPISLVNSFSFYFAYKNTSIANAVLTHYTAPIIVAFLAPVFLRERITFRVLTAVAVATAGLWIMLDVSPGTFIELLAAGDKNTGGILAGLLSGFAYAMLIILFRIFAQSFHPLVMTLSQNVSIAILLLPFIEMRSVGSASGVWVFVLMGIVHSTIAPLFYFRGMKKVTANHAAILGYMEPVCAIILGALFLGEAAGYRTLIGGAMILFSGLLTIRNSLRSGGL